MTTWFSSDLHHRQKNIVKFTNRGKDTTQEAHDDWLIEVWNKQVRKGDTVYLLGDISFSSKYEEVREFMHVLNGKKIIIKGNHDDSSMLNKLLDNTAISEWRDYKEIKLGGITTCLFHFKITNWHKQGYGSLHLYGHSHGSSVDVGGKCLDVGLDSVYNIFGEHKLLSEEDVLEYMQGRTVKVEDHHKDRTV